MPIPSTPLIENLAKQIDKELKMFLESEKLRYMEASPATLTLINDKLKERFHTDGIEATYSSPHPWKEKRVNISISDSYVLTRLKAISENEYDRVVVWMQMNGYAVPPIETDAYMHLTGQDPVNRAPSLQVFDGSAAVVHAEQTRQQFIQNHFDSHDAHKLKGTGTDFIIHDESTARPMPKPESCLTLHSGSATTYLPHTKNTKPSTDGLTIY